MSFDVRFIICVIKPVHKKHSRKYSNTAQVANDYDCLPDNVSDQDLEDNGIIEMPHLSDESNVQKKLAKIANSDRIPALSLVIKEIKKSKRSLGASNT